MRRLPWDACCKPLHQNAVACSRSTLFLERACYSQQPSSASEFQQPRSFTSLCKSPLILEFDKIHTLRTACTNIYKSSIYWLDTLDKISHYLFQPYNQKVRITVNGIFSILCFKRSHYFITQSMYMRISNNYSEYYPA